eukprot:CAMPEP_0172021880 /NCGR_PEP_ID=MMETSP1041-20130122/13955_1 /TAXON_ID=464988 /ORGANISM="Hemiselmis andersenii, Strain CCMP439" /LENGTH=170 /DNA_ID=CAMNT_0012677249 /DNA_START=189 /DNA_END=701 /DNA_ORIENTATION=-
MICLVGGVGGLAEKRPPHTAPGLRRASKELRGGGDVSVLDQNLGVGASVPRETSEEHATEKLWVQLLQSKDDMLRKQEEASKALLREKEEASKQKDLRIAEQNNLIVELRGRTEAVIANRYIVETTATLHERSAGRMSSSSLQGSKNFTYTHLLDNKKPTQLRELRRCAP